MSSLSIGQNDYQARAEMYGEKKLTAFKVTTGSVLVGVVAGLALAMVGSVFAANVGIGLFVASLIAFPVGVIVFSYYEYKENSMLEKGEEQIAKQKKEAAEVSTGRALMAALQAQDREIICPVQPQPVEQPVVQPVSEEVDETEDPPPLDQQTAIYNFLASQHKSAGLNPRAELTGIISGYLRP